MLHGIDITIFDVAAVVGFIADQVLPEPSLPDTAFVARDTRIAAPILFWQRPCKPALDQPPPHREVAIVWRQGPDPMQMIRQHDEGIDRERIVAPRRGNGPRNRAIWSTSRDRRRSIAFTVKKHPPGT